MACRSGHCGRTIGPPEAIRKPKCGVFRPPPTSAYGPIHGFATGSPDFAPFNASSNAALPLIGTCGSAVWVNIALFAVVEARRSSEECAGIDRAARRPPPSGRSCSARGRQASRRAFPSGWSATISRCRPAGASVPRKFARWYASAWSCGRTALAANDWHDSRVHFAAFLPSLIHCSAVPRPL